MTKISKDWTSEDWIELRNKLLRSPDNLENWARACDLLDARVNSRFINPMRAIEAIGANKGEGFAITALTCALLEFIGSILENKTYKHSQSSHSDADNRQRCIPNTYSSSAQIFTKVLTGYEPFSIYFNRTLANRFFSEVRCPLVHDASTAVSAIIRLKGERDSARMIEETPENLVVYREPLLAATESLLILIRNKIMNGDQLTRSGLIRKFDYICGIEREFYFAYGSNMDLLQLRSRIGHIHDHWNSEVYGYKFAYNKTSIDGTSKANILNMDGTVHGVCFEIDRASFDALQKFEIGYKPRVVLAGIGDVMISARTYLSDSVQTNPPSEEYRKKVVSAARKMALPDEYISSFLL